MKKSILLLLLLCFFANSLIAQQYDLLIRNGLVYDGSGKKPFKKDIAIQNNKIVAIGNLSKAKAIRIINANGLAVSPGFIDLHTHIESIHETPDAESHVRQGITLALGGPDGGGPWPFGKYLDELSKKPLGLNVAYLTGHNTIRKNIMQLDNRTPTTDELEQMKKQVEQSMQEGAFGFSTGLKYLPGTFSNVDEVIALSKVAASFGGFYTSHLREEGLGLIDAVQEALIIGREANIPIVLTHHKAIGKPSWGASKKTLLMVDSANNAGLDIQIDQYPYTASYTGISVLIPSWALAGGNKKFKERIADPVLRDSIKTGIIFNIVNDRGSGDISRIQFGKVTWMKELAGKTMADWALMKKMEPTPENGAELVIEAESKGGSGMIYHAISDEDVDRIMKHPKTMIASDGRLSQPGVDHPHPRAYGTFPRVLGYYVREKKLLTLEEAIKKMTGLPAARLGLKDRGIIAAGNYADLVIFDPATVKDKATFTQPHQYPEGIPFVIVNGVVTVDDGKFTANRGGKLLYGPAKVFEKTDSTDIIIKNQMALQKITGLSLAVVKDGKTIVNKGFGLANVELNVPVSAETVFRLASISKQFFTTAILKLQEEGKLSIDDHVHKYFGDAPETWKPIQLKNLMSHTSGLPREAPAYDNFKMLPDLELVKSAYNKPLEFATGEKYQYCNLGYYMLAQIITQVSGQPWDKYIHQNMFVPAGMNNSYMTDFYRIVPNRAMGYEYRDSVLTNATSMFAVRPSGGFLSTTTDIIKWDKVVTEKKAILKSSSWELLWKPFVKTSDKAEAKTHYGFGWSISEMDGHPTVSHSGANMGFKTHYTRFVKDGLSIIVLTNQDEAQVAKIINELAAYYFRKQN